MSLAMHIAGEPRKVDSRETECHCRAKAARKTWTWCGRIKKHHVHNKRKDREDICVEVPNVDWRLQTPRRRPPPFFIMPMLHGVLDALFSQNFSRSCPCYFTPLFLQDPSVS